MEENIFYLKLNIEFDNVVWIHLAQDSVKWWVLVNTVESSCSIKDGEFLG
jgi:hypothetical protein